MLLYWGWFGQRKISQQYRARNQVERAINVGLILCSGVAILTTIGIVMSMFGEAMHFFRFVSPMDFSLVQNGIRALVLLVMLKAVMVYYHCYGVRSWSVVSLYSLLYQLD